MAHRRQRSEVVLADASARVRPSPFSFFLLISVGLLLNTLVVIGLGCYIGGMFDGGGGSQFFIFIYLTPVPYSCNCESMKIFTQLLSHSYI